MPFNRIHGSDPGGDWDIVDPSAVYAFEMRMRIQYPFIPLLLRFDQYSRRHLLLLGRTGYYNTVVLEGTE